MRGSGRFESDAEALITRLRVSIPFIAGQWSLHEDVRSRLADAMNVSIPFIAGQWSLPWPATGTAKPGSFQSPSLRGSGRFGEFHVFSSLPPPFQSPSLRGSGRFQRVCDAPDGVRCGFQSPSLRGSGRFMSAAAPIKASSMWFQSPSLRGSGRFGRRHERDGVPPAQFQSPSLRGSGRFMDINRSKSPDQPVSIPFIAGQWSLRGSQR